MLELILNDGFKSKDMYFYILLFFRAEHDILSHGITFSDHNYTVNRVVTDIDWSPQIS